MLLCDSNRPPGGRACSHTTLSMPLPVQCRTVQCTVHHNYTVRSTYAKYVYNHTLSSPSTPVRRHWPWLPPHTVDQMPATKVSLERTTHPTRMPRFDDTARGERGAEQSSLDNVAGDGDAQNVAVLAPEGPLCRSLVTGLTPHELLLEGVRCRLVFCPEVSDSSMSGIRRIVYGEGPPTYESSPVCAWR